MERADIVAVFLLLAVQLGVRQNAEVQLAVAMALGGCDRVEVEDCAVRVEDRIAVGVPDLGGRALAGRVVKLIVEGVRLVKDDALKGVVQVDTRSLYSVSVSSPRSLIEAIFSPAAARIAVIGSFQVSRP